MCIIMEYSNDCEAHFTNIFLLENMEIRILAKYYFGWVSFNFTFMILWLYAKNKEKPKPTQ